MAAVIQIDGLRKTYRNLRGIRRTALDGLDMTVEEGAVHGFLGPNGSGKTTTLRILLGLVRATSGQARLLGKNVPAALPSIARQIGAVVENPRFFAHFTGRDTLALQARMDGVSHKRVTEVLEIVDLRDRCNDRIRTYSLGMKQRLAVASALITRPKILILDEPTNGLDPAGIRQMRDLVRSLAASQTTVVMSTHILAEVQQVCDSVTIISQGRRVAAGSVAEVLSCHSSPSFRVRCATPHEMKAAASALVAAGMKVVDTKSHLIVTNTDTEDQTAISRILMDNKLPVLELTPVNADLESVFLKLTESLESTTVDQCAEGSIRGSVEVA